MRIWMPLLMPAMVLAISRPTNCASSKKLENKSISDTVTMDGQQIDGPYIRYVNDEIVVNYIYLKDSLPHLKSDSFPSSQKDKIELRVATDVPGKFFTVKLKSKLDNEKSEFNGVSKEFICSDIEGQFGAFRKLLQLKGVIDDNFNWTFGNGHLVLVGDFFDRGTQVTEVLWLIYSLEDKAKEAGGYVHLILGNHEIMNLSSDIRYVQQKYRVSAGMMGQPYEFIYEKDYELGRWLRTKNIVEKVGHCLFAHGGISGEVNNLETNLAAINRMARPHYADTLYDYKDLKLATVMDQEVGPFWYRGYYMGAKRADEAQVDISLSKFGIRHIVTGHTIVSDTVSAHFHGKVFDVDTHHAEGKSEALYVEDDKYYRVTADGERLIWKD